MAIKQYKPTTAGRRGMSVIDYKKLIDTVEPLKSLLVSKGKVGSGRNNTGRITVRHKGGGVKRLLRIIDFKRSKKDIPGKVEYVEYDPNRTAFIARILYRDGERQYILAPDGLVKGMEVIATNKGDVKIGNCMPLSSIPFGTVVHNVELTPGKGGQLARSAGNSCQLVSRNEGYAQLRMPSGETRKVREQCCATIGQVSNTDNSNVMIGKAGRRRLMGIRPTVRGVAMNPVDHPHGGGEGRTSGGRHPCSPWALPTKGHRTRKNKRTDKYIIRKRYAKNNEG
jgi:large subunit ribosomal protein L2